MAPTFNTHYQQLDAQAQLDTLELLEEAAKYLKRLPTVPSTYALLQKIESHMGDPEAKAREGRRTSLADSQELADQVHGGFIHTGIGAIGLTPEGAPLLQVRLRNMRLTLDSPAAQAIPPNEPAKREQLAYELGRAIVDGTWVDLRRAGPLDLGRFERQGKL